MNKSYYTYILASKRNGALYIDVTEDLANSVFDHKCNLVAGITSQYAIHRLVYFERHGDANSASLRANSIKQMHRIWKLDLIEQHNPGWRDLYDDIRPKFVIPQLVPKCRAGGDPVS
jgi:putative endonuclease